MASSDLGPVDRFRDRIANPRALLVQVGAFLLARAQKAFSDQRRGPYEWKARRVPNVAGIVADLREGRNPPTRRLDDRPALVDTGHLRRSLTFRAVGDKGAEVGTNVPYASLHNYGGESSQVVSAVVQERLLKLISREPWKTYAPQLYWLIDHGPDYYATRTRRPSILTTKVPARPFVTVTPADRRDIATLVGRVLRGEAVTVTVL